MVRKETVAVVLDNYVAELKMLEKSCDAFYAEKYPNVLDYFLVEDKEIDDWYENAKRLARERAVKKLEVEYVG